MPLAPLPENTTARYIVKYVANGRNHTVQFRYDDGGVSAPPGFLFLGQLTVFFNAMAAYMPTDWELLEAWYIASGSIVTVPAGLPSGVTAGLMAPALSEAPGYFTFVGRSVDGRKVRLYLLGVGLTPANDTSYASDYRITAAEDAVVAAAVAALDVSEVLTISGELPLWKTYVNLGYNYHWQKKLRG